MNQQENEPMEISERPSASLPPLQPPPLLKKWISPPSSDMNSVYGYPSHGNAGGGGGYNVYPPKWSAPTFHRSQPAGYNHRY